AAGDQARRGDAALAGNVAYPELGPVPGQVRVVPGEPAEAATVRREARVGVEVASTDDDLLPFPVQAQPDQGVDRLAAQVHVVLPDREEEPTLAVDDGVGVAAVDGLGDRARFPAGVLAVEALVREVAEPDSPAADGVGAAPVLVDAR